MFALKDSDFVVRKTAYQIAGRARKTEQQVIDSLTILSSPDSKRLEPQLFDGRRIQRVEDGWLILNAEKYRNKVQEEMKKARWRRAQAAKREREKTDGWRPPMAKTAAEVAAEKEAE